MLRAAIERAGIDRASIQEAAGPAEALAAFEKGRFDIVFLDMVMGSEPGPSAGLGVLGELLLRDPLARIVLMTSLPPEHPDVVQAMGFGAFAHLRKPVRIEAIKGLLLDYESESGALQRIR